MANTTSNRKSNPVPRPCPKKLREQIKTRADDLDYGALWKWYERHCPEHLRGQAPDMAAILSVFPPPATWAAAGVTLSN